MRYSFGTSQRAEANILLVLACVKPDLPETMRPELCFVSHSSSPESLETYVAYFNASDESNRLTIPTASIVGRPRHHGYEILRTPHSLKPAG
jgi:hypothetical protein